MSSIKKSTIIIVAFLLLMLVGSMMLLRHYELDLIHGVVTNTVLQKAPEGYPEGLIRQAFQQARRRSEREERSRAYLMDLFALSQRLEKVQFLSQDEVDEILRSLDPSVAIPDR